MSNSRAVPATHVLENKLVPLPQGPIHPPSRQTLVSASAANEAILRPRPAARLPRLPRGADSIDLRILRTLQREGRISYLKLGQAVHLSPTAVFERVKRLEREGFIVGYEARLDEKKLGAGNTIYIELRLERACNNAMQRFNEAVRACPDIIECHLVAGEFDYLIKARACEGGVDGDSVPPSVRMLPGVRDMRTVGVKNAVKHERTLIF